MPDDPSHDDGPTPEGPPPTESFRIPLDGDDVEAGLRELRDRLRDLGGRLDEGAASARHTKVRLSYRGERIGPDIPLTVFLAAEGALFLLAPWTALLGNLAGKAFLEVEVLHAADELVAEGNEAYLHGETELAEKRYREALSKRPDDPAALYHLGVLLRVTGRQEEALRCFRKASEGPEGHPEAQRAADVLGRMQGAQRTL